MYGTGSQQVASVERRGLKEIYQLPQESPVVGSSEMQRKDTSENMWAITPSLLGNLARLGAERHAHESGAQGWHHAVHIQLSKPHRAG